MVIASATRHVLIGPWVRGQLALHHVSHHDPRMPLDDWLAAVHATLLTAPVDQLKKFNDHLVVAEAQIDPERARATWGTRPEHQVTTPAEMRFGGNEQR